MPVSSVLAAGRGLAEIDEPRANPLQRMEQILRSINNTFAVSLLFTLLSKIQMDCQRISLF